MFNKKILATCLLSLGFGLTACVSANSSPANIKSTPKSYHHTHAKAEKDTKNPHHEIKAHKDMDMMAHHHFDKLALTDAQQKQIDAITAENQAKIEQLHTSLAEQEKNIKMYSDAKADTATLLKLYQQKQATIEQMSDLHKASEKQFIAILTPEQQLQMYQGHKKMDMVKHHPHMDKHHHQHIQMKKPEKDVPKADLPKPAK